MRPLSRRLFIEKFSIGLGTTASVLAVPSIFNFVKADTKVYEGKKLNVALCGLGNYAEALADGLQASNYCKLTGLITGHPAKAETWKTKYKIEDKNIYNYKNFDEIANNKDIDVVYVVLPNALHKEFTIRAAKAGKHVICEKPMATSVVDCEAMIAACKNAEVQLAIGYRLHYEPTHQEIMRLGQEKIFGQVRFIEAGLGYKTYDTTLTTDPKNFDINSASEWRLKKAMAGGGPLMDLGVYCIQASRYTLGEEPSFVTAQFGTVNDRIRFAETEESITWQMEFPSGTTAACTSSYGFNIDRFFASADNGFFELSPALSYGPFKGKTNEGEINFPVINQQAAQLDGIGKLILEGKPLPKHITGEEGLKDIKVVEATYKAARTGTKVKI